MTGTPAALVPVVAALAALPPVARLLKGGKRADIGGVWSSSSSIVAGLLAAAATGRVVVVSPGAETAEATALDLAHVFPHLSVAHIPVEEEIPVGPESRANRSDRLVALTSLLEPGNGVLVVPGPVLFEDLPAADGPQWLVEKGGRLDREELLEVLSDHDFVRVPLVASPGEVSLRGDIIDIYPWASDTPVRIELFDDEVEDLRRFAVDDQRSVETLEQATLRLGSGSGETRRITELLGSDTLVVLIDPPHLKDRLVEVAYEKEIAPRDIEAVLGMLRR
ncbi:MAG: transcription-repair coupling factor (superfamily II helicase), partial [Pseudohongiellaceae bacterium]